MRQIFLRLTYKIFEMIQTDNCYDCPKQPDSKESLAVRLSAAEGILRTVRDSSNVLKHIIPSRTHTKGASVTQSNDATIVQLIEQYFEKFDDAHKKEQE